MSQYTTEEVLSIMENWYAVHKDSSDFDESQPFKGFDALLGRDLSGIDLSVETIQCKAQEYVSSSPDGSFPPWYSVEFRRLDLCGAIISQDEDGKRSNLRESRLQGAGLREVQLLAGDLFDAKLKTADLAGANLERADLRNADLNGTNLSGAKLPESRLDGAKLNNARLDGANLQGANLNNAYLQGASLINSVLREVNMNEAHLGGANLMDAELQGASLNGAELRRANFNYAQLSGVFFYRANFKEALLDDLDWSEGYVLGEEKERRFTHAETVYRQLKQHYTVSGHYAYAGEFHYREMEARRKQLWRWGRYPETLMERLRPMLGSLFLQLFRLTSGYGERPFWVLGWSLTFIIGFTFAYFPYSAIDLSSAGVVNFFDRIWRSLYFSVVSFTNLGYGGWLGTDRIEPHNWTRNLGAVESILGLFLTSLFLVTFVRKMARV